MGKSKKVSDKVRSKKMASAKKINPFEVHVNKQKHKVLGKKLAKFDHGMPGVSRAKAIEKRKETLLVEYKKRGKANTLLDKRFGENDTNMTADEMMLKRFALERQKASEKSKFNLNDDDEDDDGLGELTHLGQSLSELEKFEDPKLSDDDSEDEERGKIGAKIVGEEHFGGGTLKKSGKDEEEGGKHKTWKEKMEEIIAKSKREKYERQHEKEMAVEMTEKLDREYTEFRLQGVLMGGKGSIARDEPKREVDEYDIMVREMQFELKGKATDRLKTEEEIAKEEKERLEKLETERQKRMHGEAVDSGGGQQAAHRSADDLDDGFILEPQDQFEARYKDGKLLKEKGSEGESEEGESDEDDEEKDAGEDESEEESEEEEDGMGAGSDLDSSDEDDAGEEEVEDAEEEGEEEKVEEKTKAGKAQKKTAAAAAAELPYTFPAPATYEDLLALLEGHTEAQQLVIVERLRKCHHPSLAEGNKAKLETLFSLLLRFYLDAAVQTPPLTAILNGLVRHLYQLCQMLPVPAASTIIEAVAERQEEHLELCQRRGNHGHMPQLDTLLLLKLVAVLFPTSDFRHPVVTPTMLLMSNLLTSCSVHTLRDVTAGVFLSNVFLEYVSYSKRYASEPLNFLRGVLFLAIPKKENKVETTVLPPFRPLGKHNGLLEVQPNSCLDVNLEPVSLTWAFNTGNANDSHLNTPQHKACLLWQCLSLLVKYSSLYTYLPSYVEIFEPLQHFWSQIPLERYPSQIQELISELDTVLAEKKQQTRKWVAMPKAKPHALRLYEPKIEENFDPFRKKRTGDKQQNEEKKLAAKYKKEMKGALREVRKDAAFIASEKLKEQMEKDAERKRKVKEIYGQLASQEGDYQAIKRHKDKP